jgi:hypothetical protein
MTAPMIAGQILHFKGGGGAGMTQARHPELVSGSYFRRPHAVTLEPKACRAQLVSGSYFRR